MSLLSDVKKMLRGKPARTAKKITPKAQKRVPSSKNASVKKSSPAKSKAARTSVPKAQNRPKKKPAQRKSSKKTPVNKALTKGTSKSAQRIPKEQPSARKKSSSQKKSSNPKRSNTKTKGVKNRKGLTARGKKTAKPSRPRRQTDIDYVQQMQQQETIPVVEKKVIKYPIVHGADNDHVKMVLPILRELVKKGQISDWIINFTHTRGANLYAQKNGESEDELASVREDLTITIYERFEDGMMGEARIPIITTDPSEAKAQILDARTACASAQKPAFDLPEPQEGIEMPQGFDATMLTQVFEGNGGQVPRAMLAQARTSMQHMTDVKMNCCEFHVHASAVRVITSTGVDISFHKTAIYLEAVLTCKRQGTKPSEKTSEREFSFSRTAVSPEQLDIQGIFLQQTQIARDATNAEPNQGFTGDVLLAGSSVTEFFAPHHDLNPLVLHTSAKLQHMGLSSFKIGQPIGVFTSGEPITITTNPSLPMGLYTMPVDEEGTPLRPVELVRNGLFASYLATARYSQYLQVPVTGNITNVMVSHGATREEHLRGNNYLEIVSFSWFNPNPLSGDFSAEIRLAYRWQNGRKAPVRGGMFTGNVFTNILAARLSKEVMQSGGYYGPRAVLFKNAVVTKSE